MCLLSINNLAFGSRVYSGRTLVTSFLRGSFMPMDFRAVCLVRAIFACGVWSIDRGEGGAKLRVFPQPKP